jgi:hypothetical protein
MPVAKQDRRSKKIHHEEHEAHEEWDSSASSSDSSEGVVNRTGYYTPQVLFVSFVVKQICAFSRCSRTDTTSPWSARVHRPPAQEQYSDAEKHRSVGEPATQCANQLRHTPLGHSDSSAISRLS